MTLTEFLLARIAEDEAVARAATIYDAEWTVPPDDVWQHVRAGRGNVLSGALSVLPHAARWDPARVLAECEAKRRIVAELETADAVGGVRMPILRALAAVYSTHPDYRAEWGAEEYVK